MLVLPSISRTTDPLLLLAWGLACLPYVLLLFSYKQTGIVWTGLELHKGNNERMSEGGGVTMQQLPLQLVPKPAPVGRNSKKTEWCSSMREGNEIGRASCRERV